MHAPPISDKRHSRLFGRVTSWCSRQCACPDSIIPYHHYAALSMLSVCMNRRSSGPIKFSLRSFPVSTLESANVIRLGITTLCIDEYPLLDGIPNSLDRGLFDFWVGMILVLAKRDRPPMNLSGRTANPVRRK
ncbi:hypothetical protein AcV5_008349 [Taiwanofungus camphoratus]|nr:hypothetical protein AcV5_008349 [Antrodia cinnamomea]KAI0955768.1 hypothetical protein AcV7_006345 [Antrodia cinnamomea]